MKSSSGEHYLALDHVRALAAYMVVSWHFVLNCKGYPFGQPLAAFPMALLYEGHTGVALFMTLSGYLFSKLMDGKTIDFGLFIRNRALRLLPLLCVVMLLGALIRIIEGASLAQYGLDLIKGLIFPTLPYGAWSITVEFQFYLVLPFLLWMMRRSPLGILVIVVAALALRVAIFDQVGQVWGAGYWTLIGRIDQFIAGMLAFRYRHLFARRHFLCVSVIVGFCFYQWTFAQIGGFKRAQDNPIWIWMPTVEGIVYGAAIAWYDGSFKPMATRLSRIVAKAGEYSYSVYLLHMFVVAAVARFVSTSVAPIQNVFQAAAWSLVFYIMMVAVGHLSFRFIEAPFLRNRGRYTKTQAATRMPSSSFGVLGRSTGL